MVTFDDVLPTLLRVCESRGFASVQKATVVRDLRGRIRLALRINSEARPSVDVAALELDLSAALGDWFAPPLLGPGASQQLARLRDSVLRQDSPWLNATWEDALGGSVRPPLGRWHLIERHLSKLDWTSSAQATTPWPLIAQKPAIVTFYSFKGGVGRTTILVSTAWQLALDGKRVVAIDLDVEAPGLGSLLGASARRGVVDFLVDHAATKQVTLDGVISPASALNDVSHLVDVVTAGNLDYGYFEKLARLDFLGSGLLDPSVRSPVREALRALLSALAHQNPPPDYILIDSRAGLHDVAGLSLHDLAHVDVLVGRDSDQSYKGLHLTVAALSQRRKLEDIRCVVVQSLAPDDRGSSEYGRVTEEYRIQSHSAFAEHVYPRETEEAEARVSHEVGGVEEQSVLDEDGIAELDDDTAAHYPRVVRFQPRLLRFTSIGERRAELLDQDFKVVKDRIVELCTPEQRGA